jgi:hypothetical protein
MAFYENSLVGCWPFVLMSRQEQSNKEQRRLYAGDYENN